MKKTGWASAGSLVVVVAVLLAVPARPASSGPPRDFGNARTILTVDPDEGLPAAAVVTVEGAGFVPSRLVDIVQCSAPLGSGAQGPGDVVCSSHLAAVLSDGAGHFGPVTIPVTRTFNGTTGGNDPQPATHTCAPSEDCVVYVISEGNPLRYAYHHLDFAE